MNTNAIIISERITQPLVGTQQSSKSEQMITIKKNVSRQLGWLQIVKHSTGPLVGMTSTILDIFAIEMKIRYVDDGKYR